MLASGRVAGSSMPLSYTSSTDVQTPASAYPTNCSAGSPTIVGPSLAEYADSKVWLMTSHGWTVISTMTSSCDSLNRLTISSTAGRSEEHTSELQSRENL